MFHILLVKGFDGLFLGRIDYQDQKQRIASKNMEMVWLGHKNSEGIKSYLYLQCGTILVCATMSTIRFFESNFVYHNDVSIILK